MSKKMLKRSLALGALMAFVITGQAWAADAVKDEAIDTWDGSAIVNTKTGNNDLGEGQNRSYGLAVTSGSYSINKDVNVTNEVSGTNRNYGIVVENSGKLEFLGNVTVGVKATDDSTQARGLRINSSSVSGGSITIEGNLDVTVNSQKGEVEGIDIWGGSLTVGGETSVYAESDKGRMIAVQIFDGSEANFNKLTVSALAKENYSCTTNGVINPLHGVYINGSKVEVNESANISLIDKTENGTSAFIVDVSNNTGEADANKNPVSGLEFKGSETKIIYKRETASDKAITGARATGYNTQLLFSGEESYIDIAVGETTAPVIGLQAQRNGTIESKSDTKLKVNVAAKSIDAVYGIISVTTDNGYIGTINLEGNTLVEATNNGTGHSFGIYGEEGANIDLADTTVTATSKEGIAYGVYAKSEDTIVDVVGDLTITATGDKVARGIEAREGSSVTVGTDAKTNNVTINAVATNENAAKDWVIGVFSRHDGSEVDIKGDTVTINATATGTNMASGILANTETTAGTAKLDIDANNIIITADATTDGNAAAITTMSGSETNIKGNLTATADKAIYTRGNAKTVINESGKDTVVLNGDIAYAKGYETESEVIDAEVIINLNNAESALNGSIYAQDLAGNASETLKEKVTNGTTLALSNGATWTVKENSFVNTLVGDGGNVKVDMTVAGEVAQVEVMSTEIDSSTVSNLPTNLSNVAVSGTAAVTDYIAKSEDKEAAMQALASSVKTKDGKQVDSDGTYTTDESAIAGAYTFNVDGNEVTYTQAANQTNTAIGESAVALKAHWRAHMNDMNKRMGELRMANGETGVWTRMVRGEAEYESAKMQYNQYQLGYDEKLSVDKRWTVGAAVTFSEGDSSFYKGSTEDDSTAFAIYGSKLNNDGTYVDLIARYARLESDITTATDKSDYSTNGMSVSAEFGKRIEQGNGLWIEPQFELTYGSVDSAEYVLDGKNVQVGDMDSLIGRIGFSIGKDIEKGNVYARASYLYDFDGETETTFSAGGLTDTIKEDLGGGWWEVGVGANINLSKATYIYADVEKTFGGEVDTNWQWNLGVRYSF